jgi:FlaA1/EpsC-like NDP-sugar epimerase
MDDLSNASILVTGGTGSFGKAFIAYALEHLNPRRIAVLSRDELSLRHRQDCGYQTLRELQPAVQHGLP